MQYKTAFQKYGDFMLSSKLRKVWFVVGGELLVLQYSDIPNRSRTLLAFKGHYSTLVVAELTATMLGGFLALWRQSLRPWHSFSSGGGQEYSISIPMFLPSKNGSLFRFSSNPEPQLLHQVSKQVLDQKAKKFVKAIWRIFVMKISVMFNAFSGSLIKWMYWVGMHFYGWKSFSGCAFLF